MKSRFINKYTFILCLILALGTNSYAQDSTQVQTDTTVTKPKKVREPFRFELRSVRIGGDLSYPILLAFDGDLFRMEANTELNISNRFIFTLDGGFSQMRSVKTTGQSFEYINEGYYGRIGVDYNVLHKVFDKDALFVGLRYGQAFFDHKITYNITGTVWQDYSVSRAETGLQASWVEAVTGLKVCVWKNFYTGYTLRLKIRANVDEGESITPNDLPGFGNNTNRTNLNFNYHIYYEIPFGKKK